MVTTELPSIQKILIVRLGSLGDIIHAMPAQQLLHRCLPQAQIHWLTESAYTPLVEIVPGVTRVWVAGLRQWSWQSSPKPFIRLIRGLRRERFDLAFDFQGLVKSAIVARVSGARLVAGFAAELTRERMASAFYTRQAAVAPGEKLHVVDLNLRLAGQWGCMNGVGPVIPLQIPEASVRLVREKLAQHRISRPVLLNPGAGWATKLWPPSQYAALAQRIRQQLGIPVVVTYGPREEGVIEAVRKAGADICGFPTSILELAALCRESRLMVAGDTGPLHLAVALGTPTVAIMGPSAVWRNRPYTPEDIVVKRELPCSDCYKRTCDKFICMDIPVEQVFQAVVKRLGVNV
ncbi:MAG: glycosyltransferase family 9 protein [Acidobacteriota bacterium]